VKLSARTRITLAWSLWLVTVGCCVAFLTVTLVLRPLTLAVVADAVFSLVFLLGYATVGLVVTLRRPANPIGGRYVRVKGAGHNIHLTQREVVWATVDQVWKAALGR
jgi:hypothetical protein